jgi:hypothetical protein
VGGVKFAYIAADTAAMTPPARTCVFVLGLAAVAGWYAGIALLPLAAWVVYEAALGLVRGLRSVLIEEAALHQ